MQTPDVFKRWILYIKKKRKKSLPQHGLICLHYQNIFEKSFSHSERHYVLVVGHFILSNHHLFEVKKYTFGTTIKFDNVRSEFSLDKILKINLIGSASFISLFRFK